MFKFNFSQTDGDDKANGDDVDKSENESTISCKDCREIIPSSEQIEKFASAGGYVLNEMQFDGQDSVIFFPVEDLIEELTENSEDINYSEQNRSDIVPGVYEGGAKIWECTQDLGLVLTVSDNDESKSRIVSDFAEKTVLDLGCGAGILGILALNAGATVHFQDYNETIIEHVTIPNVIVNMDAPETNILARGKFYSGDWSKYVEATKDGPKFDYILTSETIYNPQNYQKLMNLFKCKLKSNGIVFLAAKSVYFGVGGSVAQFIDAVDKDGTFTAKIIHSIKDNVFRDILEIKFKC